MQILADKYEQKTGNKITNEYELHTFHINDILAYENAKESLGHFYTSMALDGRRDPVSSLSSLLITARGHKNIVVIEVDEFEKVNLIQDESLKFAIVDSTVTLID